MLEFETMNCRLTKLFFCVLTFAFFAVSTTAEAQRPGARNAAKGPSKKTPAQQGPKVTNQPLQPGAISGTIIKYELAEGSKEENLVGELTIRPLETTGKTLKVKVYRIDSLHVEVGGHKFEIDEFNEILWKGLTVTAGWAYKDPNAKKKIKELKSLTMESLEITGEIEKIEDGMVFLKAKPANGRDWPDAAVKPANNVLRGPARETEVKRIPTRKLKLKIMDDVTQYQDASRAESDLTQFEPNQKIEATIIYGRTNGMLVALRLPWDGSTAQPDQPKPQPMDPRGGGPPRRPGARPGAGGARGG